jgi:pantoate--beta-alanine ligase
VIRQLVRDLGLPIEIVGVPTQRDADGLALSSRNAYLSEEERQAARILPRALGEAAQAIEDGADVGDALARARARLGEAGFAPIDYVELRDAETLAPLVALDRPARLLAAARIGKTRLIDNLPVNSSSLRR